MNKQIVVIYIDGQSYQLNIDIDDEIRETTYEVITSGNILKAFIPDEIDWQEDSILTTTDRKKLIESEQIARIIWTDILDMLP